MLGRLLHYAREIFMQVNSTAFYSPYVAQRISTAPASSTSNSSAGTADQAAGRVSTYDFANMSPAQMQDTMNGLIRSGRMSFDDSSSLVGMIPTALAWAGGGTPSAAQLDSARNTPMDFLATLQAGIAGAQSRGDTHNAETLTRTLELLQRLQGTPSGVDVVA
ncbi:hypothetical protein CQ14_40530 [Bradyrhizobium lablabi]|uniref:Uncharacterized protein n=2 Tax=Bradyrhizobium lablabi TaxID=722472 RepID=A0A0R3MG01_9BRAD|nr:hypothetical protein CQ14_40530 [Bradyrhizobium lablabi]